MRQIFWSWIILQISIASAINWSAPATLFSSDDYDGTTPLVAVHPTEQTAMAAWIASGSGTIIYGTPFTSGSWGTLVPISASANVQASLNLGVNEMGTYVMVCDLFNDPELQLGAAYNAGGSWSPTVEINNFGMEEFIPLNLATQGDGTSIITWQGSDGRLYGMSYSSGAAGTPYPISQEELSVANSIAYGSQAIFATSTAVYATPIAPMPVNTLILPRQARASSLCLDSSSTIAIFGFQDQKSHFFLSALSQETEFTYAIIAATNTPIASAKIAIDTVDGHATAIWQLSTGQIETAHFDGIRWGRKKTLSTHGASPSIAFDPTTGCTTAIWADFTAGGTANTIQTAVFQGYSWSSPAALSDQGAVVSDPHIKINSQGNAFAIWARQPTTDSNVLIEAANSL